MELGRAKGTRDFLSEEKILRQEVERVIQQTFEVYGFSPIETPVIELAEVLTAKYAGGEEILQEMFTLQDQGKRKLALRYDLTVPMARVVGMNPQIKLPFKRYQMEKVFRDGPLKPGRYREFVQCDADIIGPSSAKADAECVSLAKEIFQKLKIPVVIKINSRKVLDAILEESKIPATKRETVILTIDKLEKIGFVGVEKELRQKKIAPAQIKEIKKFITLTGTSKQKLAALKKMVSNIAGVEEIEKVLTYEPCAVFDVSLARGLAYYTGIVIEVFAKKGKITSSLVGGGRYDNMIGAFRGNANLPAVGISFGLDTIIEVLKEQKREMKQSVTQVFVIPIKTFKESLKIAQQLRAANINTEIDLMDKCISKNLDYANKKGIPLVIFIGQEELKKKKVKLRDMQSGKEENLAMTSVIKKLKN